MLDFMASATDLAAVFSGISIFALFAALIARKPLFVRRVISGRMRVEHLLRNRKTHSHPSWLMSAWLPSHLEKQARLAGWTYQTLISALARAPIIIAGFTVAILAALVLPEAWIGKPAFGLIAFAGATGAIAPYLLIRSALGKRRKAIARALPDTLELLAMVLRAGLGVDPALRKTADSITSLYPELAQELRVTLAELQFLPSRRQAYHNLEQRTGAPGLSALAASLSQANQHGAPVAQAVSNAAATMRAERLSEAERRAASLPAKLAAPLVIFFIPAIFVVVLVPAVLRFLSAR